MSAALASTVQGRELMPYTPSPTRRAPSATVTLTRSGKRKWPCCFNHSLHSASGQSSSTYTGIGRWPAGKNAGWVWWYTPGSPADAENV
jgi:hypothetical protein